jgi:hypothetical protein
MGTVGNGDGWPDSGQPDGLPDLPAEWGRVVIPDDPAELAAEAEIVRQDLRREHHLRARRGYPPAFGHPADAEPASVRLLLLIMSVALLATLTSLLAVVWQANQRPPGIPRASAGGGTPSRTLPALELVDAGGSTVGLRSLLPAVLILTEGCTCTEVIAQAAAAAPAGVTVVPVTSGRSAPSSLAVRALPPAASVRALADPTDELHSFLTGVTPQPGTATVLLVALSGEVVRVLPGVTSVEDYRNELLLLLPSR